jgi:hypothetical protein
MRDGRSYLLLDTCTRLYIDLLFMMDLRIEEENPERSEELERKARSDEKRKKRYNG